MNKIIKYVGKNVAKIFIVQYIIIIVMCLLNINMNKKKNSLKNHNIVDLISTNFQALILIYHNKNKDINKLSIQSNNIKKQINKYLFPFDYYYLLINNNDVACTYLKYNKKHYMMCNGKIKQLDGYDVVSVLFKINIKNSYEDIYYSKFVLYKYKDSKFVNVKNNISVFESYKTVRLLENINGTYNILSACLGSQISNLFINELLKNTINYHVNNYVYEGKTYHDKSIENSDKISTVYINNNNSFFDILTKLSKKKYDTMYVNKFELNYKYIFTCVPLYKLFMYLHLYNVLKYYKSNKIYSTIIKK